ncbi:LCP family protein [Faecalitalea cylindroides]|uniref:LCP family protein n=1 Tax=Faecalitalea cylindroides TaxID=39483 RepID=UPI00195CD93B|nr:LCP family protein [Faecalitalea cylindroides]MBM6810012.1 LCP family protein [Faecalitalea cylindroides]
MKNDLIKRIISIVFSIILVVCTLYLLIQLVTLNVLPSKFLFIVVAILFLIDAIIVILINFYSKKVISKIILIVVTIMLSIGMGFGGYYLQKTNTMFSNITNVTSTSKNTVSVIVKESSDMQDLRDIADKKVGTLRLIGLVGTQTCLEDIESKDIKIEQMNYDSISNLMSAFYSGEVDVVILNESYRSNVEDIEEYKNFSDNTRVIYQTTFETEDTNVANSVSDITEHPFNVLITGSDSRVDISENARSDVNMVVTVNPTTNTILLTSIPRDFYVTTVCDAADGCQNGAMDKITHTGMTGINTTKRTVENLLGIEINYTVKVGFESVTKIVDALGGIDVYVEPGYAVPELLHGNGRGVTEGVNHLDGKLALAYSRERYAYTEGDRQRTKNQQQVVMGIIDKMTSSSVLANYADLMDALGDTFQTTMSASEIQALIQYQMDKMPSWTVEQYMVDGAGDTLMCAELGQAAYVMVPDQTTVELAKRKIAAVMDGGSSTSITSLDNTTE